MGWSGSGQLKQLDLQLSLGIFRVERARKVGIRVPQKVKKKDFEEELQSGHLAQKHLRDWLMAGAFTSVSCAF